MTTIYHLARAAGWRAAQTGAVAYEGRAEDQADGFLHFSTAEQIEESAAAHCAGITDLVLLAVDGEALGDALRWEISRGGALFPHVYGVVPQTAVLWAKPLRVGDDGAHIFPALDG